MMTRRRQVTRLSVMVLLVLFVACAKAPPPPPPMVRVVAPPPQPPPVQPAPAPAPPPVVVAPPAPPAAPQPPASPPPVVAAPAAPAPAEPPAAPGTPAPVRPQPEFAEHPALQDVFFESGRAEIGRDGTRIMQENARWLQENPGNLVLIEGHSDYKGTREANIVLGERRARAALRFLVKEGVAETRLETVSHGSERPVCVERTEACAAKNRRVHFLVKPQ